MERTRRSTSRIPTGVIRPLGRIYANFAPQVPSQYTHPFITLTKDKFSQSLNDCVKRYESDGDKDFDAFVRQSLKTRADEARKQIARNPY